jgi:hypothetical protein
MASKKAAFDMEQEGRTEEAKGTILAIEKTPHLQKSSVFKI